MGLARLSDSAYNEGERAFCGVRSSRPLTAWSAAVFDDITVQRFWSKVDRRGPDECWPWIGSATSRGYGRLKIDGAFMIASRVSLALSLKREIGPGMLACHHCDNPPCVNPKHLFEGTTRDNAQDAVKKGRMHKWRGTRSGEGNPRARLTHADVAEIRRRLAGGATLRSVAKEFNVSHVTICDIKTGRGWKQDQAERTLRA